MPSIEHVHQVVSEWVARAEQDFSAASHLLDAKDSEFGETISFLAQQSVEKYLKVLLVVAQYPVPKTHDIERVVSLLPTGIVVSLTAEEIQTLTGYAVETRYPWHRAISTEEARRALDIARRVRLEVRAILPPNTLEGK